MYYTSLMPPVSRRGLLAGLIGSLLATLGLAVSAPAEVVEVAPEVVESVARGNADDEPAGIFHPIIAVHSLEQAVSRPGIIRSRLVEFDTGELQQAALRHEDRPHIVLPLFDDVTVTLEVRDASIRGVNSYTMSAVPTRGVTGGFATIAVNDGVAYTYISLPRIGQFTVQRVGDLYRVTHSDPNQMPVCGVGPQHAVGTAQRQDQRGPDSPPASTDVTTVYLVVLYTEQVLEHQDAFDGDLAALEAAIIASVATANVVLDNSEVNVTIKLVDMSITPYNESGSMSDDLANLADGEDAAQQVTVGPYIAQKWRSLLCAHFMSMIVFYDPPEVGGIAYLMLSPTPNFAPLAVNVVNFDTLGGTTLIHEIGHNMGCHHDHAETGGASGTYSYSHGHRWEVFDTLSPENMHASVMTYPPYVVQVPIFSNPLIEYPAGFPTGIHPGQTGEADNSLTIINNTPYFKLFAEMLGGPSCAESNIYFCPDDFPTIQAAINAASDRDQIWVRPGVYPENIDFKGKAVHVRSMEPNNPTIVASTIIDGQGNGSVVSFVTNEGPDSVLQGFTIRNGSAVSGGGIHIVGSSPTLASCRVVDNEAVFGGGGMYVSNGSPSLRRIEFIDNTALNRGGGLSSENSTIFLQEMTFSGNTAGNRGGGLYLGNGNALISANSLFENNVATSSGGGIFSDQAQLVVRNSTFDSNLSFSEGGGIVAVGGLLEIEDSEFTANETGFLGGGVFVEFAELMAERCSFSDNVSMSQGGAMYVSGTVGEVRDSTILDNLAAPMDGGFGGGLYIRESPLLIIDSRIDDNTTAVSGGAVFVWVDLDQNEQDWILPTIQTSLVCNNMPNNIGGPWINGGGNNICALDFDILVPSDYSTIQAAINAAQTGDVIVVSPGVYPERINFHGKAVHVRSIDPNDAAIVAATVIDGEAGGKVVTFSSGESGGSRLNGFTIRNGLALHGGGVYISNSSPFVENCVLRDNVATSAGGALAVFNGEGIISNLTFLNNTANNGGGMYVETSNALLMQNCLFQNNHANSLGGGLANLSSSQTSSNLTFDGNTAGQWGGGMFNGNGSSPTIFASQFNDNSAGQGGGIYSSANSTPKIGNSLLCANSPNHIHGTWVNLGGNTLVDICPPLNNVPENAEPIGSPISTIVGSFTGATNSGSSSCDPSGVDVFYSYTVLTGPANMLLDTCGSDGDTNLAVFDSTGTELACNTTCEGSPCGAPHACVALTGLAAGEYLIRVSRSSTTVAASGDQFFLNLKEVKTVPGDLNLDGVVDVSDLLILLSAWGPCSGCAADLNGDGAVDVSDLLILLANWG